MRPLLAVAAALLLGACGSLLPTRGPQSYFRLDGPAPPAAREQPIPRSVLVAPVSNDAVGNAYGLLYSRTAGQRAFYQYSDWTDRPTLRVAQLLMERLEVRRAFASIARLGSGIAGDVRVNVMVDEAIHDLSAGGAGEGRISFSVEVLDHSSRRLLARRYFAGSAPAQTADAAGGAAAINAALATLLEDAAAWVEAVVAQADG